MVWDIEGSECFAVMAKIGPFTYFFLQKGRISNYKLARLWRFVNKTDLKIEVNGNNHGKSQQTFNWSTEGDLFGKF